MSDEKYTTVSIKDEDREILDKIKQLEKLQSKSQVVTKIIKESKYNSINRIIEEKFDEIRDMIPTERLDGERDKLLKLEAIYKQVVSKGYEEYKSQEYKKLFEEDKYEKQIKEEVFENIKDEENNGLSDKEQMILQGNIKGQK